MNLTIVGVLNIMHTDVGPYTKSLVHIHFKQGILNHSNIEVGLGLCIYGPLQSQSDLVSRVSEIARKYLVGIWPKLEYYW